MKKVTRKIYVAEVKLATYDENLCEAIVTEERVPGVSSDDVYKVKIEIVKACKNIAARYGRTYVASTVTAIQAVNYSLSIDAFIREAEKEAAEEVDNYEC